VSGDGKGNQGQVLQYYIDEWMSYLKKLTASNAEFGMGIAICKNGF
jgi:hypothetical protein